MAHGPIPDKPVTDLEEMAGALGVSPERLKRIAVDLVKLARSGPTVDEFARELQAGVQRITIPASEAFAGLNRYRS